MLCKPASLIQMPTMQGTLTEIAGLCHKWQESFYTLRIPECSGPVLSARQREAVLLFHMQQSYRNIFAHWHEAGRYVEGLLIGQLQSSSRWSTPKLYKWEKTTWASQLGSFSVYSFGRDATTEYHRLEWVTWQKCIIPVLEARSSRSNGSRADSFWGQWRIFWLSLAFFTL